MYSNPYHSGQFLPPAMLSTMSQVGLSPAGMQEAAKHYVISQIDLDKRNSERAIDFYWKQQASGAAPNASIPLTGRAPDLVALSQKFIAADTIVKKKSFDLRSGRFGYFVRDKYLNRHVSVAEDVLKQMFYDFVFDNVDDLAWDDEPAMRRAFRRMLHAIPLLSETNITVLDPTKIVAFDSVFDLQTGTLTPVIQYPRGLFNTSSLPLKLLSGNNQHPAFDALLTDCFSDAELLKQRTKEIIGALVSPVKSKKSIFVLQGVGNAGKTRLARLVVRHILQGAGVFWGNDFSDLMDERLKHADTLYSLVFIRDSVDKAIAPKQRSALKSYGDAGYDDGEPTYKLLVCTNNAIYTGDNGFVERPLLNRCVVLSFAKPMDNTNPLVENFEELHLESELPSIVLSCLQAYAGVLKRGGQFSGACELNAVVEPNSVPALEPSTVSTEQIDTSPALGETIDKNLEFTGNPGESMTSTEILQGFQAHCPELQASPESLGRALREAFGEEVAKRTANNMRYFVRFKKT